ncbi:hypothetical protein RvY_10776 [Ramazzottius varieornatus]|uniref:Uncharacterized protein n=1 Tax=Ramazzottius varieornatus TaxID=947166 RepID=A0A1D1VGC2_RAMVA|nr:hypothetical protein RvY_10776 [Ramazzottius varieornatus]
MATVFPGGIGYAMVAASLLITFYYNVLNGWVIMLVHSPGLISPFWTQLPATGRKRQRSD